MRGDSLRDFYAKTLAVMGLGLIAGAGAIVDYWPTGIRLPETTSPAIARITAPPLIQNLNQQVEAPKAAAGPITPAVHVSARHVRWPGFAPKPDRTIPVMRPGLLVAAITPLPEPAITLEPEEEIVPVNYTAPVSNWAPDVLAASHIHPSALDASLVLPESPTGFIGGALKKTKDSLVKTGVVTGGSIADAVRGVVGAFKKVSPF